MATGEGLYFSEGGRVLVHPRSGRSAEVRWRVRGQWLEIDTSNDGTFQTRMRAIAVTDDTVVAVSPTGEKSTWTISRVKVVG